MTATKFLHRFILLVACMFALFSCQKELSEESGTGGPVTPPPVPPVIPDSAYYISSFKRVGIESNDPTWGIDSAMVNYIYSPAKIMYHFRYYMDGAPDSARYAFYYDASNRLIRFENEMKFEGCVTCMTFLKALKSTNLLYSGDRLSEINAVYEDGSVAKQQLHYSGDGLTVTVYDTLPTSWAFDGIYVYQYKLNADKSLASAAYVTEDYTPSPGDVYDTTYERYVYDAAKNLTMLVDSSAFSVDTTFITGRESRGSEVAATLNKLLPGVGYHLMLRCNMAGYLTWAGDAGYGYSLIRNILFPATGIKNRFGGTGTYTNTFDAGNRLIRQIIPDGFATKTHGPAIIDYFYTKTAR